MRRLNLKRASSGFTLIELIITIVIIGVLAAVAIPKFQSLSGDAEKGAGDGVAAALGSATSVNYAKSNMNNAVACAGTTTNYGVDCSYYKIASCADLKTASTVIADLSTWAVDAATTGTALTPGASNSSCKIVSPKGTTVNVTAYGA